MSNAPLSMLNSSETSKFELQDRDRKEDEKPAAKDKKAPRIIVKTVDNKMLQTRTSQDNDTLKKRMKKFRENLNSKFETSFSLGPWLSSALEKERMSKDS